MQLLKLKLTNVIVAKDVSLCRELPCNLWNPNIQYRVHTNLILPLMSGMNSAHAISGNW
jgi:hypothetical protein